MLRIASIPLLLILLYRGPLLVLGSRTLLGGQYLYQDDPVASAVVIEYKGGPLEDFTKVPGRRVVEFYSPYCVSAQSRRVLLVISQSTTNAPFFWKARECDV